MPRPLAAFGLITVMLHFTGILLRGFLGYSLVTPMGMPMGLSEIALALWWVAKGLGSEFLARLLYGNTKIWTRNMFSTKRIFKPDYERYDGVRPINIYLLRLLFLLVVVFVASDSWSAIFKHEGPWDHVKAAAVCMWAAYSVLSIFGLINPLKWLPIVMFEIFYKVIWLIVVAYPLWSTNRLAGSPAEGMTYAFVWVILPIVAMPWTYFFKNYVWKPGKINERQAC